MDDVRPLFAYPPLSQEEVCLEILGRRLDGSPATLPGYRLERMRGYSYLEEEEGARVEGILYKYVLQPDYWVLDQYQNVEQGVYRRIPVEVECEGARYAAYTYLGGPTLDSI